MATSIDARMREASPPKDRTSSVIGKGPDRSRDLHFLAPAWSSRAYLEDLESSDIGRDPKFTNGGWLGFAILIAAALGTVYVGFISVWALLALAVVW